MLAVLAARMFGESVPGLKEPIAIPPAKAAYWQALDTQTSQGAGVEQKARRKSGKKKWIIIGAVAGGAAVGYAIAAKRLGNEGIRIFPALR